MKKLKNNSLLKLLAPPSITKDPQVKNAITAVEKELLPLEGHLNDGLFYCRIDSLSSEALDHLAEQWSATVWRDSWPIEVKRSVLRALITDKSRLGTLSAVKKAVSSLGSGVFIREWWQTEPRRTPHTFEVVIDQNAIEGVADEDLIFDLMRSVDYAKAVRSQYTVVLTYKTQAFLKLYNGCRPLIQARLSSFNNLNAFINLTMRLNSASRAVISARLMALQQVPHSILGISTLAMINEARPMASVRVKSNSKLNVHGQKNLQTPATVRPVINARLSGLTGH